MKEFSSQDGGRYTFVDDVQNLQELALAINSIFGDCDGFVVSGCELNNDTISSGYVYLNGKLRLFAESSCSANTNGYRYLYEHNQTEQVPYANGSSKVGRTNYGVSLADTIPATDAVTNEAPKFIQIAADGTCKRLNDAFFGLYALLLDSKTNQIVKGKVKFDELVALSKELLLTSGAKFQTSSATAVIKHDSNAFTIAAASGSVVQRLVFNPAQGFSFFVGDVEVLRVSMSGAVLPCPLSATRLLGGNVAMSGNNVYLSRTNSDTAELDISVVGYGGGTARFRTTNIGNGKGKKMLTVDGANDAIVANVSTAIFKTTTTYGVVLQGSVAHTDNNYTQAICWKDVNGSVMAHLGFVADTNNVLELKNAIAAVQIWGVGYVNLCPVIKENGMALSDKYVLKTTYTTEMAKKASVDTTYTRIASDERYAQLSKGLTQFITGSATAATLRQQIGAVASSEISGFAKLDQFLADMAKSDTDKAKIRANIGAAASGDFEPKHADTGWKTIGSTGLYVRQIGRVVSIEGTVLNTHTGTTVFTLPNGIEAPTHTVGYAWNVSYNGAWACKIEANKRDCVVTYCNAHGNKIPFTLTYIV